MIQTNPTAYADINELLEILLTSMQKILGEKLVGLYLYGSLVIGDFDPAISDIDLFALRLGSVRDKLPVIIFNELTFFNLLHPNAYHILTESN